MATTHGAVEHSVARALAPGAAEPALVLVEGAAGTGKSFLLSKLSALSEAADATCVLWRCGEAETPLPEQQWEGPVLLLVDDAHRAGEQEQKWLRSVLAGPCPGLAAVVTYRPEELAVPGLPLGPPAVVYPPGLTVLRHRMQVWGRKRIRRAAAQVLGDRQTLEAADRLHEQSGGVPRVVVDLLSVMSLRGEQVCTAQDVDAAGVPARLAEMILDRTSSLDSAHRPVVWAAAVLDEPVSQEELVCVSGLPEGQGNDALLAALAGAVLVEWDSNRYGFSVPLAASAVRASILGPHRRGLHERAADVLTRRQPVPWFAVAGHRRAAGGGRGWLRAVEKAARMAVQAGQHHQAVDLLEGALSSALVPPQARARLAPLLARSAVTGLRSDQTVDVLTQIVRDSSLPVAVRGELRLDLGLMLCNQLGRFTQGWHELEVAANELDGVRPDLAGRAMAALAMPYWPGPGIDIHRQWLQKAIAAADVSGDETLRAAVLANRVWFAISCGDPDAWELVESLPADSTEPTVVQHAARGLCNAADAAVWLGFYDRSEDLLVRGRELSSQSGAPYTEHTALGTQLLVKWWTGQWAGLADQCERFIDATADMPVIASDARVVRSLLAFAKGDWAAALSWVSNNSTISLESMPTPLATTISGTLIRLALARDDVSAAAKQARTAWGDAAAKGVWPWAAELVPWAVEATARAGDTAGAGNMVRDFAHGISEHDAPAARAALTWSRAVLTEVEVASGRERHRGLIAAAKLYREASEAYGSLPRPYTQALLSEAAARCLLEVHEPSLTQAHKTTAGKRERGAARTSSDSAATAVAQAVTDLETCTERFSDLGATWDTARARALLRTQKPARKGRPPGRASHADQLTPREVEVSQLAASGLTNREIASTLHLSPRTVEQHIARAMRKMGALSRQDLYRTHPPKNLPTSG
ncbi:LuxR C-terminal-related transcriptional regulator [Streptomyces rhizosphaericola]|uniref:helix-turn-helix transcriptional regulator n=1 Tax=Streptomyces rhizosphaericola TaxID=2564098 RepID=UPI003BF51B32